MYLFPECSGTPFSINMDTAIKDILAYETSISNIHNILVYESKSVYRYL